MKFWIRVQVQCEAQEVLGKNCDNKAEFNLLLRSGVGPGGGFGLLGGLPPVMLSNLVPASPGAEKWRVSKKRLGGAPCVFCSVHAREGLAKLHETVGDDSP
jgi:hypothetical protein